MSDKPAPHRAAPVVIDTQVALDWLVFRDPGAAPLAAAVEAGRLRWVGCGATRAELRRMLHHPALAPWRPDPAAAQARIDALCHWVDGEPARQPALRCRDADDQVFIDLALATGARWLFTRDKALLALARRARARGVEITAPARWRPSWAAWPAGPATSG